MNENKFKNKNFKKDNVSKIEKIKKYYIKMNENPEKVKEYVKRKIIEILSLSDKSRYEIEEKIYKNINKNQHEALVTEIVDSFQEMNYINDKRFVENYIRIKYNSGYGSSYIKNQLKLKKVDMFLFDEYIENYDFRSSLYEYKESKYQNIKTLTMKEFNKISRKLVLRGFDFNIIKEAFSDIEIIKEDKTKENKPKNNDIEKFIEKMIKKGYGINKIKQEANIKSIELEGFDLSYVDFEEIAKDYKIKKYGKEKELDIKAKTKKINHMLGRGFSYSDIKSLF